MFRFYLPILFLQFFCFYLAYKNQEGQRWYWIILLFPLLGSLFFLFQTYYNRQNIENISEEIKSTLNDNYKLEKLEKEIAYSGTISNKIRLADEYFQKKNYSAALHIYESCLEGIHADDPELLLKLVKTHYQLKNYAKVVTYGEKLKSDKAFNASEEKIALAWSYSHLGGDDLAEKVFEETNVRFTNYVQRLEYSRFLAERGNGIKSKQLLEELISEIESMDNFERKMKRKIYQKIKNAYAQRK